MPGQRTDDVRDRLVAAATSVIVSSAGASMSLRDVAQRAGVTTGAIQHHFGDRHGLLLAVLRSQGERMAERLRSLRGDRLPAAPVVARAILLELLPLDEERIAEAQTALTFETIAVHDEGLRLAYRAQHTQLSALLAEHLPADALDVELVLAAIGGIRTDLLLGRISPDRAGTLVESMLGSSPD